MNYSGIRRLLLKICIGFLSLTALIAILSVLGREFGETQLKVLVSTFSISAGSICAMSCAAFLERNGAKAVGLAGTLSAGVAVAMVVWGAWSETPLKSAAYWKFTLTFIVVSVAFAHACLLHLPNLAQNHRWTQTVSTILIGLLGLQIIFALWEEPKDDGYYRWLAAVSVLVVLVTLVIPICNRLRGGAEESSGKTGESGDPSVQGQQQLILRKDSEGIYVDNFGRKYRVTQIKNEPGPATRASSPDAPPA